MYPFVVGREYLRRNGIYPIIGLPEDTKRGKWENGYNQHPRVTGDFFIFCNIGVPGRTGHKYKNYFEREFFHWEARNKTTIHQPQIARLLNPPGYVYLFYRTENSNPFTFAGICTPVFYRDETPAQIIWKVLDFQDISPSHFNSKPKLVEGKQRLSLQISHERNPEARRRCIENHGGYMCSVCGFNFAEVYGELGEDFIHVHHVPVVGGRIPARCRSYSRSKARVSKLSCHVASAFASALY